MAAPISQSFHDDSYCPGTVVANICRDSQKVRFKFDRYSCGLLSQAGNLRPAIEIVPFSEEGQKSTKEDWEYYKEDKDY